MSVIQKIREKAAWFVFGAIALSLLAFILQDALTRKGGGMFRNSTTVGKVNGVSIDKTDFENKLSFYEQANGAQRDQLIGSVWEYIVDQTVMQQEYNKLGLHVTSKELSDVLFGVNPPSWLQQAFTDPSTGVYNADAARQQFSQMKKNSSDPRVAQLYQGYIEPTIQQTLRQKYQTLITSAVYVPKWLAEKTNADNNSVAKISYVTVPYSTISDSTVKVSDDEIEAYVKKHSKQFEQKEETRQISYVSFDASPSREDSLAVLTQMNQLKPQFAETTDEKSFLSKNGTETPFYNSYINKNEVKQKVNDSVFSLAPGSVSGPYLDGGNYVLAKMIDKKQLPDSVKVRHILVSTHQQQQQGGSLMRVRDDSAARKRLDSAVALINSGSNFDSVCTKYSDDPGSKNKGGVYDYFPSGKMVEEFNDFVFTGKPGDKKVVQTSFGFHYIEILGDKGSSPAYKIAYLSSDIKENDFSIGTIGENRQFVRWIYDNKAGEVSEPFEVSDKYVVAIITAINKPGLMSARAARQTVEPIIRNEKKAKQIIAAKIKGNTLDAIAKSAGVAVQKADSVSFQAFIIPNIGNEVKIIGSSFNKQIQNKVSAPVAGATGVFVLRGEAISATSSLSANAAMLRQTLEAQMKSQIGNTSMNALRQSASVKDYRSTFY